MLTWKAYLLNSHAAPILPRLTSSSLFHSVSHLNGKFSNCRQTAHIQLKISHFDDNSRTFPFHKKFSDRNWFGHYAPSQGYKYILTVCDFFTKWPELIAIQDKKATTIARELYVLFTRYGCPDVIISDRGTEFCNAVSEAIFTYMRVEHRVSAPYHPQTNGKTKHLIARELFIELSYFH